MAERTRPGTIATLPNLLGVGRIVATPVVMALLLLPGSGTDLAAAIVFVVAALSDLADGWIARARDQVTPLGVFMDLAADKILVAGVLVAMVEAGLVPTWIAATLLIREFVVQAVRQLAAAEDVVISARALGKAKTLATNAGIALLLVAADAASGGPMAGFGTGGALEVLGLWVLVVGTALSIVSGYAYVAAAWPILVGSSPPDG
jgi:CDP-diacylglycerol--glycerol-3-phosphate 3-phosphatidyltransferase